MEEYNNVQRLGANRNEVYWIVYQTTNLINNKIYIGVHKTKNPFEFDGYLGNGIYVNNPNTYIYAKTKFESAVKKYGVKNFNRTVLSIFNNEEEAYNLEGLLVNENFLSRSDVYNMILGGNYSNSKLYQYSVKGEFIKEFISNNSKYIQSAILGNLVDNKYYFCYVKAENYSKARDIYTKSRTIYQYNSNGKFIKEWKYLDALKEFPKDGINQAIRHKRLTKSGYYWGLQQYKIYNQPIKKQSKQIGKYDLQGNLIKIYNNSSECYAENGKGSYKSFAGLRKSYKGFVYKYIE